MVLGMIRIFNRSANIYKIFYNDICIGRFTNYNFKYDLELWNDDKYFYATYIDYNLMMDILKKIGSEFDGVTSSYIIDSREYKKVYEVSKIRLVDDLNALNDSLFYEEIVKTELIKIF